MEFLRAFNFSGQSEIRQELGRSILDVRRHKSGELGLLLAIHYSSQTVWNTTTSTDYQIVHFP